MSSNYLKIPPGEPQAQARHWTNTRMYFKDTYPQFLIYFKKFWGNCMLPKEKVWKSPNYRKSLKVSDNILNIRILIYVSALTSVKPMWGFLMRFCKQLLKVLVSNKFVDFLSMSSISVELQKKMRYSENRWTLHIKLLNKHAVLFLSHYLIVIQCQYNSWHVDFLGVLGTAFHLIDILLVSSSISHPI